MAKTGPFEINGTQIQSGGKPDDYGLGQRQTAGNTDSNTRTGGSTSGSTSGTTGGTSSGTSTQNGTSTTNQTTTNLDGSGLAALQQLIAQLARGGTPEMLAQKAQRTQEINSVRATRSGYSKDAAFSDAHGAVAQQMRKVLESLIPSISRASEDAGSSGGALRALLVQDAGNKAAESSAALGLKAATDYGNINANFSQVLEALTRSDPSATNALVGALGVAKGATTTTNGTTTNTGTTTNSGTTSGTSNTNTSGVSNENKSVDYAPFQSTNGYGGSFKSSGGNMPIYFGPSDSRESQIPIGSTLDTLLQLQGGSNAWSGYKF